MSCYIERAELAKTADLSFPLQGLFWEHSTLSETCTSADPSGSCSLKLEGEHVMMRDVFALPPRDSWSTSGASRVGPRAREQPRHVCGETQAHQTMGGE